MANNMLPFESTVPFATPLSTQPLANTAPSAAPSTTRIQWKARSALAQKQQSKYGANAKSLPLKVFQLKTNNGLGKPPQARLMLSGRMADVCSILNRMEETSRQACF